MTTRRTRRARTRAPRPASKIIGVLLVAGGPATVALALRWPAVNAALGAIVSVAAVVQFVVWLADRRTR